MNFLETTHAKAQRRREPQTFSPMCREIRVANKRCILLQNVRNFGRQKKMKLDNSYSTNPFFFASPCLCVIKNEEIYT